LIEVKTKKTEGKKQEKKKREERAPPEELPIVRKEKKLGGGLQGVEKKECIKSGTPSDVTERKKKANRVNSRQKRGVRKRGSTVSIRKKKEKKPGLVIGRIADVTIDFYLQGEKRQRASFFGRKGKRKSPLRGKGGGTFSFRKDEENVE